MVKPSVVGERPRRASNENVRSIGYSILLHAGEYRAARAGSLCRVVGAPAPRGPKNVFRVSRVERCLLMFFAVLPVVSRSPGVRAIKQTGQALAGNGKKTYSTVLTNPRFMLFSSDFFRLLDCILAAIHRPSPFTSTGTSIPHADVETYPDHGRPPL